MSDRSAFERRERAFEARYFQTKNDALVEKLRAVFHKAIDRESIRQTTAIVDQELRARLAALQPEGEMMAGFQVGPLSEVGWADHARDARARRPVLEAAEKFGVHSGSPAYDMLERRLAERPSLEVRKLW